MTYKKTLITAMTFVTTTLFLLTALFFVRTVSATLMPPKKSPEIKQWYYASTIVIAKNPLSWSLATNQAITKPTSKRLNKISGFLEYAPTACFTSSLGVRNFHQAFHRGEDGRWYLDALKIKRSTDTRVLRSSR